MNRLSTFAALTLTVLTLAACNTVRGAGQDIQSGGEVISDTATNVQQEITN